MTHILEAVFPLRGSARLVQGVHHDTLVPLVSATVIADTGNETVTLLPYRDPLVSALIIEAKYHESTQAFDLLGRVLAEYVQAFVEDEDEFSKQEFVLVPVPLSLSRLKERGYNQTERICRSALAHLGNPGAPCTHVLSRARDTASQTHLAKEKRLTNMEHAFHAEHIVANHTYILVDDVVTTGATLNDAMRALKAAGASRVISIALAH